MKSKTEEILEKIRVNNIRCKNYKINIEELEAENIELDKDIFCLQFADADYDPQIDGEAND